LEFVCSGASGVLWIVETICDSRDSVAVKRAEISVTRDGFDGCSDSLFGLDFPVVCGPAEPRRARAAFRICLPSARCEGFGFIAISASTAAFSVA
jgi:hypothetical protein